MGDLPDFDLDPTLVAMNEAIVAREAAKNAAYNASPEKRAPRLGASAVGDDCERKAWYSVYRRDAMPPLDAASIVIFEEGHRTEDIVADRLRLIHGIELWTKDDDGKQYRFTLFEGRFVCKPDGIIRGLRQAPTTTHVWEHKSVNEKKFNKLNQLKEKFGEKNALKLWDPVYFTQAQLTMGGFELTRHYMTVTTPGARAITSCRTDFDAVEFENFKVKASRIIRAKTPPIRISEDRSFYKCKFCDFQEICHENRSAT